MDVHCWIIRRKARVKAVTQRDGSIKKYEVKGGYFYRLKYVDPAEGGRTIERGPYRLKSEAKDAMTTHTREVQVKGGRGHDQRRWTFNDLADHCLSDDGIYAEGAIRSRPPVVTSITHLRKHFGEFLISGITRESIRAYHKKRLKAFRPTKKGEPKRTITEATVNRELATLRAMIFFAIGEGWTVYNPFFKLKLITTKNEVVRDRLLSEAEEGRLLAACEGSWTVPYERTRKGVKESISASFTIDNKHLKAMIILALDCAMRRGEILQLEWSDIDLISKRITIRADITKTQKGRVVALSDRAISEIRVIADGPKPFPFTDIKHSFATVKRLAGISDLRFHDLRRTAITRMQEDGVSLAFAGKSAGHSQLQTTMKHYTVIDDKQIEKIRESVNTRNEQIAKAWAEADDDLVH